MIRRTLAVIDAVSNAAAAVAAVALAAMAALMLAEVFSRNLLNTTLLVSWEYSSYLMAAMFFLAAGATLRSGGHVRVSILGESLPARAARLLDIACTLAGIVIGGLLAWALIDLAQQSIARGARSFLPSETPIGVPQAVVAIGAAIFELQLVARLARLLAGAPAEQRPAADELPEEL